VTKNQTIALTHLARFLTQPKHNHNNNKEGGSSRKGKKRRPALRVGGSGLVGTGGGGNATTSAGGSSSSNSTLPLVLGRRQDQPPSARTGQYHRQQEVKMQRIRSLFLASLSINCVCGFLLATMTGYVTVVLAWGFFTRDVKTMPATLIPTKVCVAVCALRSVLACLGEGRTDDGWCMHGCVGAWVGGWVGD
jgi:hypothetical protein